MICSYINFIEQSSHYPSLHLHTQNVCFGLAGENLTARLRLMAFRAMLRQEISWFDKETNSSCVLTAQLAEDTAQVQGATGKRLGSLLEAFIAMTMSIIIAFAYSWTLTLVVLGAVPIVVALGALEVRAFSNNIFKSKKSLEHAEMVLLAAKYRPIKKLTCILCIHR